MRPVKAGASSVFAAVDGADLRLWVLMRGAALRLRVVDPRPHSQPLPCHRPRLTEPGGRAFESGGSFGGDGTTVSSVLPQAAAAWSSRRLSGITGREEWLGDRGGRVEPLAVSGLTMELVRDRSAFAADGGPLAEVRWGAL